MSDNSNSDSSGQTGLTTHLPDGTTRVQFGTADQIVDKRFEGMDMRGGVRDGASFRTNPETGQIEQHGGVIRHNVMDGFDRNSADVFSTARSPAGSPTGNINDKTIVTMRGQDMSIRTACNLGWMRKEGEGRYVVTEKYARDGLAIPQ